MSYGYVIDVTAVDRPGIVASVSTAIARIHGNIESCSQTVLDGYFTLILTFSIAKEYDPEELRTLILSEKGLEGCQAVVFPMSSDVRPSFASNSNTYVISAFGKDREGVVSNFTQYLDSKEINIIDLYANITNDGQFVLLCQVEVDPELDPQNIQYDLEALGEHGGFTVRIQHNNVFVATNQIRLDR
ncbi:MAG: glycine cleavage system protein R [Thermoguttaceae bacterium]|jgi:glycine cleavage system transcriptional repressor